jgi:hypothetical protein
VFKQIEILLEGRNPDGDGPLTEAEGEALRRLLQPGETLRGYVRGRIVGAGSSLWVLTDQALHMLDDGRRQPKASLPLAALQAVDSLGGRYGQTLVVMSAARRHSIFGAHRQLAAALMHALATLRPDLQPPPPATVRPLRAAAVAEEAADAARWLAASRARLQPSAFDAVVALREAVELRERGVLDEREFSLLKARLLQAA